MANVKQGYHVLVAAYDNSLRAMIMVLNDLTSEEVPLLELTTGVPIVYDIDAHGDVQNKEILIA